MINFDYFLTDIVFAMNNLNVTRSKTTLTFLLSLFFVMLCGWSVQAQDDRLVFADEEPQPIGGLDAFYRHVATHLHYPEEARRTGVEGRVHVQFVVDRTGAVSEVHIQRGIGAGCDEEAIRLVKTYSAGWQPARVSGKPISVEMSLPIRFAPEATRTK